MKTKITIIGMLLLVSTMSFAQEANNRGHVTLLKKNAAAIKADTPESGNSQPYHQWSVDAGYLISSHKDNANPSQPLFGGNGVNVGISERWGDRWGIRSRVGYTTGSTQSGINNYVNSLPVPPKYKVVQTKSNWSQIAVMTGPSLNLGKNHQFELSALGGIGLNPSVNTIRIDAYDNDVLIGTVYEAKEKSVLALWQVNARATLLYTKKLGIGVLAGVGSNGVTGGVVIELGKVKRTGHVTLMR